VIIVGLILLVVAAVVGLDLLWKNTFPIPDPVLFGLALDIHTARGFMLLCLVLSAVLLVAVAVILSGLRRKGRNAFRRRQERKDAGRAVEDRDQFTADNAGTRGHPGAQRDPTRPDPNPLHSAAPPPPRRSPMPGRPTSIGPADRRTSTRGARQTQRHDASGRAAAHQKDPPEPVNGADLTASTAIAPATPDSKDIS
jgi:hypothetical protein